MRVAFEVCIINQHYWKVEIKKFSPQISDFPTVHRAKIGRLKKFKTGHGAAQNRFFFLFWIIYIFGGKVEWIRQTKRVEVLDFDRDLSERVPCRHVKNDPNGKSPWSSKGGKCVRVFKTGKFSKWKFTVWGKLKAWDIRFQMHERVSIVKFSEHDTRTIRHLVFKEKYLKRISTSTRITSWKRMKYSGTPSSPDRRKHAHKTHTLNYENFKNFQYYADIFTERNANVHMLYTFE